MTVLADDARVAPFEECVRYGPLTLPQGERVLPLVRPYD